MRLLEHLIEHLLILQHLVWNIRLGSLNVQEIVCHLANLFIVKRFNSVFLGNSFSLTMRQVGPYLIIRNLKPPLHKVMPIYMSCRSE